MTKKTNIKVLTKKDKTTLQAFSNVHCLTKTQLTKDLGQSNARIQNFKKDGYIVEKSFYNNNKKCSENYFTLTQKGRVLMENRLGTEYFYTSNSPAHDITLANSYFHLDQTQRDSWVTETEQRNIFNSLSGSPCDGGYVNTNGEVVLVEIVTQNYSKVMRQEKIEFAKNVGATYQEVRG